MSSTKQQPFNAPIDVVVMAAGKGTRMKSALPKVLHRIGGRALLQHVLDTAASLQSRKAVVITGHAAAEVEAACQANAAETLALEFARQEPQLGTGHAVMQALPHLADDGVVVVLSGDVPLTQADTLFHLIATSGGNQLALLTLEMPDPAGYGRIVRGSDGAVRAIVEQKDASEEQLKIHEVYSGIMAVPAAALKRWLARLDNNNARKSTTLPTSCVLP
jgi:bifunctional UDP-N-acetylglucosamine pyrophosphorylase/glucosamine-1-phosphate N-acetyltransferase